MTALVVMLLSNVCCGDFSAISYIYMSYEWWLFDADLNIVGLNFFSWMVDQVATNIFEKRDGKWLLCCHHASHTKRWIITQFEFQFVPTYIIASPHCHKISSEMSEGTSEMSYKVRHQIFCFRFECLNGSQIKPPWPKPRCYGQCWCTHGCCCASSLLWPCDILSVSLLLLGEQHSNGKSLPWKVGWCVHCMQKKLCHCNWLGYNVS
jgi:hypothetical protein